MVNGTRRMEGVLCGMKMPKIETTPHGNLLGGYITYIYVDNSFIAARRLKE